MSERDDEKTVKLTPARRTWTLEEHDDGSVTITRTTRRHDGMALATGAPSGARQHWLHQLVADLDRVLGP